jgi:hypothetical protein
LRHWVGARIILDSVQNVLINLSFSSLSPTIEVDKISAKAAVVTRIKLPAIAVEKKVKVKLSLYLTN